MGDIFFPPLYFAMDFCSALFLPSFSFCVFRRHSFRIYADRSFGKWSIRGGGERVRMGGGEEEGKKEIK